MTLRKTLAAALRRCADGIDGGIVLEASQQFLTIDEVNGRLRGHIWPFELSEGFRVRGRVAASMPSVFDRDADRVKELDRTLDELEARAAAQRDALDEARDGIAGLRAQVEKLHRRMGA